MTSKSRPSFIPLAVLLVAAAALTCSGAANADISPIQPAAAATAVAGEHSREPLVLWSGPTGQFVTCVARDRTGWWWGTEGDGLWHYAPNGQPGRNWAHVRACDGAGDDAITALAVDRQDRLWVGTARQGVTVYNGEAWKNYDQLTGPIGAHVTGIAVSPLTGDVWMTTDAGLSIYVQATKTWRYITRADGLVSDQLTCIAFTSAGKAIVGTAADGVEMASPKDDYAAWQRNSTPDDGFMRQPNAGELPLSFDLVNCVLVSKLKPERIYVGTTSGLMWSADDGATWSFQRGQDFAAKVAGRIDKTQIIPFAGGSKPLTEDYVTCLAEDDSGQKLYVGHWRLGYEVIDEATGERVYRSIYLVLGDYIKAMVPGGPNTMLLATYGRGLSLLLPSGEPQELAARIVRRAEAHAELPDPAAPPTNNDLASMMNCINNACEPATLTSQASLIDHDQLNDTSPVQALSDDWVTSGNWLGRYGRFWACLCAMRAPNNYIWGAGWEPIYYSMSIGSSSAAHDSLRYWVHWLYTDDQRVLEMPPTYLDSRIRKGLTTAVRTRREAEADDHGEIYPWTQDGPNIYCTLSIPSGLFYLSLYDCNKDGHSAFNRNRDFLISVRRHPESAPLSDASGFEKQPELAHGRITNFWGGVWKRFLVRGPIEITIQLARNYSLDTILPAVMLDLVEEEPPPYFVTVQDWTEKQNVQGQSGLLNSVSSEGNAQEIADLSLDKLEALRYSNSAWWAVSNRRYYTELLRLFAHQNGAIIPAKTTGAKLAAQIGTCCYEVSKFDAWEAFERCRGLCPSRDIEESLKWDGGSTAGGDDLFVVLDYLATQRK